MTIELDSVFPLTPKSIQVAVSDTPLAESSSGAGDALNPGTWDVQRGATPLPVIAVSVVGREIELRLLDQLGSVNVDHTVAAPTLLDVGGGALTGGSLTFKGITSAASATPERQFLERRVVINDLRNAATPSGLQSLAGTLEIAGGDYVLAQGNELLEKLIIRRLTTPLGGFYHLPDYGGGIEVKEPLPLADLTTLQTELRRQVLLEPEVLEANVSLTQDSPNNLLLIEVRARTQAGLVVEAATEVALGGVQL